MNFLKEYAIRLIAGLGLLFILGFCLGIAISVLIVMVFAIVWFTGTSYESSFQTATMLSLVYLFFITPLIRMLGYHGIARKWFDIVFE